MKTMRLSELRSYVTRVLREFHNDKVIGGLADEMDPSDFDPIELMVGEKDEGEEHTFDPDVAQEIAMDHLAKDPHYYTKQLETESARIDELQIGDGDVRDFDGSPERKKVMDKGSEPASSGHVGGKVPNVNRNEEQKVKDIMDSFDSREGQGSMSKVTGPVLIKSEKLQDGGRADVYSFKDLMDDIVNKATFGVPNVSPESKQKLFSSQIAKMSAAAKKVVSRVNAAAGNPGGEEGKIYAFDDAGSDGAPNVTIVYPATKK